VYHAKSADKNYTFYDPVFCAKFFFIMMVQIGLGRLR